MSTRHLILVLGDQLDRDAAWRTQCAKKKDRVLMIEARAESQRIRSHRARTALFLAAMRHHAAWLQRQGYALDYVDIDHAEAASFSSALEAAIHRHHPERLVMVEAGEYGVQAEIDAVCARADLSVDRLPDSHFLSTRDDFAEWRRGRKVLVMEHFYRHMRQRHDILMEERKPAGGRWNFDQQNRKPFGKHGPGEIPTHPGFPPDDITREALADVETQFPDNPGSLDDFAWPVSREQALTLLQDFIDRRLPAFGPFQDAMWDSEPWLYHSTLSAALNLKLLNPREVIDAAVDAYHTGHAPLSSVEGFVRQILGWREYVRGVYWLEMPDYLERNSLGADQPLPDFYWSGDTDMACLRQVIGQTLAHGYAHHIQRLMVTGLFALLLGVRPREIHEWYLAVYVDAVEWVEAPNTLGMSQHADGGLLGSKPYAASGRYIQRMSNYCSGCRFRPDQASGDSACPFTTLYWDFLMRHEARFAKHPRAAMQWRNLARLDDARRREIRQQAESLRAYLTVFRRERSGHR
ncbi:MAG: cryptochrome/photolyase family protein [Chromatiaceae bacterium]